MSDETVPMLHIPDDWDTFATIHNYMASGHTLTMSARDISAGIMATLRVVSAASTAAPIVVEWDQPEPESTAVGDRSRPSCVGCGKPVVMLTDRLCAPCFDATWDAQIDAEADRLAGPKAEKTDDPPPERRMRYILMSRMDRKPRTLALTSLHDAQHRMRFYDPEEVAVMRRMSEDEPWEEVR